MKKIKRWFENDNEDYEISEGNGFLDARTDIVHYLIVEPHNGTNNKWMLRVTTEAAFDRWANSTGIEKFFTTETELCKFLQTEQLNIYKELLRYLSKEYEELEEAFNIECNQEETNHETRRKMYMDILQRQM